MITVTYNSLKANHTAEIEIQKLNSPTVGAVRNYLLAVEPIAILTRSTQVIAGMEPLVADGELYDLEVEDDYVLMDGDFLKFEFEND